MNHLCVNCVFVKDFGVFQLCFKLADARLKLCLVIECLIIFAVFGKVTK